MQLILQASAKTESITCKKSDNDISLKGWLYLILVVVAATAIGIYRSALGAGFLLDDFSHLDCAYNAAHGNWSDLIRVFSGNWTGAADNLTSYRPLISLSFVLDFLVWQVNPFGYHLSNLLMFAGCGVLTSLITLELTAALAGERTRLLMALLSGLLFALYPLHPEAVVWIIGRVDVQCALFYFSSLYAFLLFRRSESKWHLGTSLALFACALPSKEMAVTLPACLLMAELVLPGNALGWKKFTPKRRLGFIGTYWALLCLFALIRTAAIGTLVGGYGGGGLKQFFHSLRNFLDCATWSKVFYGINEEMAQPPHCTELARAAFICLSAFVPLRFFERAVFWRILGFLFLWACISEFPTYQIWHVFPNLCGSRLLFIPSASLCIILTLLVLAPFERLQQNLKPRVLAVLPQYAGAALISVIGTLWWIALGVNQIPWSNATTHMQRLTAQVRDMAAKTAPGQVVLLLDLPQDVSGAGLLGRPEFLERLLRPPLDPVKQYEKVLSAESPFPGHRETAYPHMIQRLMRNEAVRAVYKWNRSDGRYGAWQEPQGASQYELTMGSPVETSSSEPIFWLSGEQLNPFEVQMIDLELDDTNEAKSLAGKIQLVWRSENQEKRWIDYSIGPGGMQRENKIVFAPGRLRSWLYQGAVVQIGLKIDQGVEVPITKVHGYSELAVMPRLTLAGPNQTSLVTGEDTRLNSDAGSDRVRPAELVVANVSRGQKLVLNYDCSQMRGAALHTLIFATKTSTPLPDLALCGLPPSAQLLAKTKVNGTKGTITLSEEFTLQPGLHQISAIVADEHGEPIGFASEPLTIKVE